MNAAWVIVAAAVLSSFGQTTSKKNTTPPAKSDSWQRSKECAAQAEKFVADWPKSMGNTPDQWQNHYSPKYGRCFVRLDFSNIQKDEKIFPSIFTTALFDAFQRSSLASSCKLLHGNSDCAEQIDKTTLDGLLESYSKTLNGKSFSDASQDEQNAVRKVVGPRATSVAWCSIEGESVGCPKAATFISEHMKN